MSSLIHLYWPYKIKCTPNFYRYLKSIFPKVEETLLLDTLASENNNVMKTADKLKDMGFERKELTALKTAEKKQPEELKTVMGVKMVVQKETEDQKPTPPPRMKSLEEKTKSR